MRREVVCTVPASPRHLPFLPVCSSGASAWHASDQPAKLALAAVVDSARPDRSCPTTFCVQHLPSASKSQMHAISQVIPKVQRKREKEALCRDQHLHMHTAYAAPCSAAAHFGTPTSYHQLLTSFFRPTLLAGTMCCPARVGGFPSMQVYTPASTVTHDLRVRCTVQYSLRPSYN